MDYNQYLNVQRYNTEYISVTPGGSRSTGTNVASERARTSVSFETPVVIQASQDIPDTEDDGYISSDDDSFGGFDDITNVM